MTQLRFGANCTWPKVLFLVDRNEIVFFSPNLVLSFCVYYFQISRCLHILINEHTQLKKYFCVSAIIVSLFQNKRKFIMLVFLCSNYINMFWVSVLSVGTMINIINYAWEKKNRGKKSSKYKKTFFLYRIYITVFYIVIIIIHGTVKQNKEFSFFFSSDLTQFCCYSVFFCFSHCFIRFQVCISTR